MKYILSHILIVLLLAPLAAEAGGFSYVYIQGDKSVPFYVKLEDQMLPRYGKNYNLIPQLAPGPINIQILFQQNKFPAQKFTIVVPENGFRGFLLLRKGESFSLYDIHQQFYLQPGNRAEDDRAPANNTADAFVSTKAQNESSQIAQEKTETVVKRSGPKFLPDVVLNNERTITKEEVVEEPVADNTSAPVYQSGNVIPNSDCPMPVSAEDFEDLHSKATDKPDKVKLKFLLSNMDHCYTSNQSRILAETLGNDPERYTFLKRVYPRVTDQHNFPALERLLSTQEWKSYFRLILPK